MGITRPPDPSIVVPSEEQPDRACPQSHNPRSITLRAILTYQASDRFSEWLIYLVVIFCPWVYGTTQLWAIWIMNVAGYALGGGLLCKWFIRNCRGYSPPRWDINPFKPGAPGRGVVVVLAALTFAILAYCLVAAINARSTYNAAQMEFIYRSHISWLPHSYDRDRTWQSLANYLALAGFFWAVRDWLLGKTEGENRAAQSSSAIIVQASYLPGRLRRLLWILSLNGAVLGLESIAQRLSGTNKLLWLMPTRINADAEYQFGPYAYRANAAQYFNLVWPVALAFWWLLRREIRHGLNDSAFRRQAVSFFLPAAIMIMAACPIITLSRGGALVAFGNMTVASAILLLGGRRQAVVTKLGILFFFGVTAAVGLWFATDKLGERMKLAGEGLRNREATYQTARQIAREFPLYGTGPGTFEPVFQAYRSSLDEYWPRQLHNDWLETRITFGWVGSSLIALAFLLATTRWFGRQGIQTGWRFTSLLCLALGGCMIHALYDFPFQIYSILLTFLLLCAVMSTLKSGKTEN